MHITPKTECALAVAREYPGELMHLEQVACVSDLLFQAFEPLHKLGPWEREMLCCGALLHDIGLSVGIAQHHKHSLRLILQSSLPALTAEERLIAANLGRYHRKAKPKEKHGHFRDLTSEAQEAVRRLAPILRIADGLDRAHENAVAQIQVSTARAVWTIAIYGEGDLAFATWGGLRKAGLFEEVYGVEVRIVPKGPWLQAGPEKPGNG